MVQYSLQINTKNGILFIIIILYQGYKNSSSVFSVQFLAGNATQSRKNLLYHALSRRFNYHHPLYLISFSKLFSWEDNSKLSLSSSRKFKMDEKFNLFPLLLQCLCAGTCCLVHKHNRICIALRV